MFSLLFSSFHIFIFFTWRNIHTADRDVNFLKRLNDAGKILFHRRFEPDPEQRVDDQVKGVPDEMRLRREIGEGGDVHGLTLATERLSHRRRSLGVEHSRSVALQRRETLRGQWNACSHKVVWDTLQYLQGWKDSKIWLQSQFLKISKSPFNWLTYKERTILDMSQFRPPKNYYHIFGK